MNSLKARIIDRIARNAIIKLRTLVISASANSSAEIQIPMRKERGPTDILEALETTISRDPTAANYKYIDDPYFIPTSNITKRTFALAQESGKRAAMWVLQEHSDILKSNVSEPLVKAFLPVDKYEDKSQVSEEILISLIKQGDAVTVLRVYDLLEKNVTKETKQAILELLCYFNSDAVERLDEFPEERSYQRHEGIWKNMWNDNREIQTLFEELTNDKATASAAYSALISGVAKYQKADKAWELFTECMNKNIPVAVTSYNNIIYLAPILKANNEDLKNFICTMIQNMVNNGVKPNVGTLNSCLKAISTLPTATSLRNFALSLIKEFKTHGIEPSLGSYYYILSSFCKNKSKVHNQMLLEMVKDVERKEIEIQDLADLKFFTEAMDKAKINDNLQIGHRLHKLLLTKNNYKFVGGRLQESVYYRHYLQLILNTESIEEFMKIYNSLVPHIYIPEPAVMRDILKMLQAIDKERAIEIIPIFVSQVVKFGMLDRSELMGILHNLMTEHCCPPEQSPLNQQYAEMAWTLWNHYQHVSTTKLQNISISADLLGDISLLQIRANEFEKMLELLNFLVLKQNLTTGIVKPQAIKELFDACIMRGHSQGALIVLEYAIENLMQAAHSMIVTIRNLPLSETEQEKVTKLEQEINF